MSSSHKFSVIIDTYYRPAMLKDAVDALFRQTYENLEIILVNNGATPETVEYLHQVEALDKRVKLVHFQENQFTWKDPVMLVNCWNAALEVATGDYLWYQADDDLIADDYAEKMVDLFRGNPECTSAAGLTVTVDQSGKILENISGEESRNSNFRPTYMPGHLLALDMLRGGKVLFGSPGTVFSFRRDVQVKAGGYHRSILLSHHYGLLPFGVTGFDETALFYWRRHQGQMSGIASARGWLGIDEDRALLKDWEIGKRWSVFGADVAKEVVSTLEKRTCQNAANWFVINFSLGRIPACMRIFSKMWHSPSFWQSLLAHPKDLLVSPIWSLLKPPIRWLFALLPKTATESPMLASLRERVTRPRDMRGW